MCERPLSRRSCCCSNQNDARVIIRYIPTGSGGVTGPTGPTGPTEQVS